MSLIAFASECSSAVRGTRPMTAICLCMIVRNESPVVEETLDSVADAIADYVIVDTGSEDATVDVIESFFRRRGIPGRILHRPWRDFGHNRSEALHLAREFSRSDYLWMIDADDVVVGHPQLSDLTHDGYHVRIGPSVEYWRLQIFKRTIPWRYAGVLHEYPTCDDPHASTAHVEGDYCIHSRRLGDRNRDPLRYWKDAAVLEEALRHEPDNARYAFYLAQSYFDAGDSERAMACYHKRIAMGGWEQEVFYSRLRAAECLERLGRPWAEARAAYLDCFERHPTRAEPLVRVAVREREAGNFSAAYEVAARAARVQRPGRDALFLQRDVYDYRALDEQAIAAYYVGRYDESFRINAHLLRTAPLPEAERGRIETNRDFSVPRVTEDFLQRDADLVGRLAAGGHSSAEVTLSITTCKRLELFVRTIHSFLNACTDLERIGRWICVDDGSSPADRREMERLFPFFEFVWKSTEAQGHARSMNVLLDTVTTPFWLHLEDDWQFFESLPYVGLALEILDEDPTLGQVLFNRHYAEGVEDRRLAGGIVRHTASGKRYIEHLHLPPGTPQYDEFFTQHPRALSNVYWPHYSLRPSLLRTSAVQALGRYSEGQGHFELEFARRYRAHGFKSAFLDTLCSLHIGRRTGERFASTEPNAYELNQTVQFGAARPIRIKLLANWCSSEEVCRLWDKMSRGGGRWGQIEVTADDSDVDFYAVINAAPADARFVPRRTIVFHMEPSAGIAALPGEWRNPDPTLFLQVRDHRHFPNPCEWHLGKTWEELRRTPIEKTMVLSTVTSSRYQDPGQKKRVDFIKYLQERRVAIDVYGRTNEHGFIAHRGALPPFEKERGLFPYRYTFAAENHAETNYFTEKLVDAILSECLCFYWGCPNLSDYLDPRAFVRLDLDDFEVAARTIREAIEGGEWERRIDVIRREKRKILDQLQFFPTLERIVTDAHGALLRRARRLREEGRDAIAVRAAYEDAFREDSTRAEPLWELACSLDSPHAKYEILERIKDLQVPPTGPCEPQLYEWRILDELAIVAYYAHRFDESFDAYDALLRRDSLPASERPRVESNLRFTLAELSPPDVVVINLDRRADRLERLRARVTAAGLHTFRRFAAIDGQGLRWTADIRRLFGGNDFGDRRTFIGCALSHLGVWRDVQRDTLVLEDDAEPCDSFLPRLHSVIRRAGRLDAGWDLILLGYHPLSAYYIEPPRISGPPTLAVMRWEDYLGGSFAYLVSPRGAAKLLAAASEKGVRCGIDRFMMRDVGDLAAYMAQPCIAFSPCARSGAECDSDIQYDTTPLAELGDADSVA